MSGLRGVDGGLCLHTRGPGSKSRWRGRALLVDAKGGDIINRIRAYRPQMADRGVVFAT